MITEANAIPRGEELSCDLVIIGAGAAGITLALELEDSGLDVILLEAGGMQPDPETQALYAGVGTGLPYFGLDGSRLRYFGGTTNHWGGVCQPFEPVDFEVQDGVPLSGWPIDRSDLDAYYARAAERCNANWSLFQSGLREAARAPSFGPQFVPRVVQRVPISARRFRQRYTDAVRRATSVHALLGANVIRIRAVPDASRVGGVDVATLAGNRFRVDARACVVAAGATENARLLLASNDVRPGGLGNDHDLVGRYFLEHPRMEAATLLPSDPNLPMRFYDWHRAAGSTFRAYLALSPDTRRREGLPGVQFRMRPRLAGTLTDLSAAPAVQALTRIGDHVQGSRRSEEFAATMATVLRDLTSWQDSVVPGGPLPVPHPRWLAGVLGDQAGRGARLHAALGDVMTYGLTRAGWGELQDVVVTVILQPVPNPESRVTLDRTTDTLGVPRAQLHWALSDVDRSTFDRALRLFGAEIGRLGLGRLRLDFDTTDPGWPEELRGGYHQMGTTRMSNDPRTGVVDRECRVHGLANLYVAGSSVFPTGGDGAPTITIVALAIRLADHLRRVWSA